MTPHRLSGRTVVLTRPEEQSRTLSSRLHALGARILLVPAIRFAATEDLRAWEAALEKRSSFSHLVFTSQVAARYFADLSVAAGVPLEDWRRCRVAAIGGRTAETLTTVGLPADFVALEGRGVDLATALIEKERVGPGCRVLLPRSAIARPEAADLLEAAGAAVDAVALYETLVEDESKALPLFEALDAGTRIDAVLFASPSAARSFLEMTGDRGRRLLSDTSVQLVSIGSTTSEALEKLGLRVDVEARAPDTEALVEAVLQAMEES